MKNKLKDKLPALLLVLLMLVLAMTGCTFKIKNEMIPHSAIEHSHDGDAIPPAVFESFEK